MIRFPKKKRWIIPALSASILLAAFIYALLLYFGILHLNRIDPDKYPVTGIDVSSYQGEIDWKLLSSQNISFAFIKATEGSSHVDPFFETNWRSASETDLRIGAYHFFSFESPGDKQAEHFQETVEPVDRMLPPVVDVEFYGGFRSKHDIDPEAIKQELRAFVNCIERNYSVKPIIYATDQTYDLLIRGSFDDCTLWYRSVYTSVPKEIPWTLWQFSNRHVLSGYKGRERFIDMNVFNGTVREFEAFFP